ncbi:MAG: type II secretion system GspH family protein [Prevotella sp.]|nr:type II secretion system GspH family protein [Prevotella sp.]
MKKNLKGFTLIELIIVMAMIAVLMTAIMQLFKPIRSTYVDSTLYEAQRTAQNGIVKYIGESIRYSTDLGFYTSESSADNAIQKFTKAYLKANGVYAPGNSEGKTPDPDYSAKEAKTLEKMRRTANVIIIDNATVYPYNNAGWQGRILRRKFVNDSSYTSSDPEYKKYKEISANPEDYRTNPDEWRLALSAPYYGDRSYTIVLECGDPNKTVSPSNPWKADDGIAINVASFTKNNPTIAAQGVGVVRTSGEVVCKNLCSPINGMFDIANFTPTASTGSGTKVYIVYTDEKVIIET